MSYKYDTMPPKKKVLCTTNVKILTTLLLVVVVGATVGVVLFLTKDDDQSLTIPLLKPPVESAAPAGFKLSTRRLLQATSSFNVAKDRFFRSQGPSSIYALLDRIDVRTQEVAQRATALENNECIFSSPMEINIDGWPGEALSMSAQCYEVFQEGSTFMMFSVKEDSAHIYEKDGMVTILAHVDIVDDSVDKVDIYFSVGTAYNTNQTGSRGLMHLEASPKENKFQASMAGIGLGFCGVQIVSDGTKIKIHGSQDGIGGACEDIETICMSADLEEELTTNQCDSLSITIEPLGRQSTTQYRGDLNITGWDASTLPNNNVDLTSIANFGPSEAPLSMVVSGRKFGQ